MKNPKILYILIGAFCILAIIAGIYAQFFVREEDKNNIIMPSLNQTDGNTIGEKTAEEIKTQFANLFTNVLNKGQYDTSKINKINTEKEIVYSVYERTEKKENYEISIHLPAMNIAGEIPESFNRITQSVFADKASEIIKNNGANHTIYQIDYVSYINDEILSLIIKATLKEGNNPQRVVVQAYNYNLQTGEKVELSELLTKRNLIQSDVQNKINETVIKAKEEAEVLVQSGYSVYNRNLNNEMYQLDKVSNYFLGVDGNLYIVFAYGNQNYTSEMDIILYE